MSIYWSHSALKQFNTCAYQYEQVKLLKNYKQEFHQTTEARRGDKIHKALEDAVVHKTKLPPDMSKDPMVRKQWRHLQTNHRKLREASQSKPLVEAELELGIDWDWKPCGFWDKTGRGMFRGKIDLITTTTSLAYMADYKSGNPAYADPIQLDRMALLIFKCMPSIKLIKGELLWLKDGSRDTYFYRKDIHVKPNSDYPTEGDLISKLSFDISVAESALKTGTFPAKKSGLCRRHCPVSSCVHHGGG